MGLRPALCGAVTGVVARTAVAPIDFVKINWQVFPRGPATPAAVLGEALRAHGPAILWRGNAAGVAYYALYGAVQWSTYEAAVGGAPTAAAALVGGAAAAAAATAASYPLDLMRTRHTAARGPPTTMAATVRAVIAHDGVAGLYRGLGLSLGAIVPAMGLTFGLQRAIGDAMQRAARHPAAAGRRAASAEAVAGAAAGAAAKVLLMPLEVVRKRLQVARSDAYTAYRRPLARAPAAAAALVAALLREEGIGVLWRGTALSLAKTVPVTAISFGLYGFLQRLS